MYLSLKRTDPEQRAGDKYECSQWAATYGGFNPSMLAPRQRWPRSDRVVKWPAGLHGGPRLLERLVQ